MKKINVAILCSGNGSNMQAIAKASIYSDLNIKIATVVTNTPEALAIQKAKELNIETKILPKGALARDQELDKILEQTGSELILLAGYLKKLPTSIIDKYKGRILNIHPSLLPKYGGHGMYGIYVHQAVKQAGEKETGATVHLVTGDYDKGPIVLQEKLSLNGEETPEEIAQKVIKIEHLLYINAIKKFLESYKA